MPRPDCLDSRSQRALFLIPLLCILAACHHTPKRDKDLLAGPDVLYNRAYDAMKGGDYSKAIKSYESLEARFPFSDAARQGRLDLMFAYYKNRQPESAVDAADQFIRESPTHPRVDYAYYMKGLVYYERLPGYFERLFGADPSQRPPSDALKAFAAFGTLIRQYPKSDYAHDARARMLSLRNRLADYEVTVARYYVRRTAWVGALARAKYAIENYDGAPATREALSIMAVCYRQLNMIQLAEQTESVYRENFGSQPDREAIKEPKKRWWRFW